MLSKEQGGEIGRAGGEFLLSSTGVPEMAGLASPQVNTTDSAFLKAQHLHLGNFLRSREAACYNIAYGQFFLCPCLVLYPCLLACIRVVLCGLIFPFLSISSFSLMYFILTLMTHSLCLFLLFFLIG